jgi:predicted PurR-regulated permease PerM
VSESTARRAFVTTVVAVTTAGALVGAWYARDVLFLVFAAWLLALVLDRAARYFERHTPMSRRLALAGVLTFGLLPVLVLTGIFAADIVGEVSALSRQLPSALAEVQKRAATLGVPLNVTIDRQMMRRVTGVFSTGLGALGGMVFVVFLAIFFAAEPRLYRRGLLSLFPPAQRERAGEAAERVADTLQRWLVARLILMASVAVMTTVGLALLKVPTPLALGALAGILDFVPNVGPILAAVPAILLAFDGGSGRLLAVVALYVVVQTVEAYVLTPLIERKAVQLPPGLILAAQALLGYLTGWLGLMFATPLTAAALLIFKEARGDDDAPAP